ncbi:MAG: UDP-2,4-diacetamido-2,4,6-trideoxy-beta-L-altropyranose hydrolase [Cyclobacteriaceae bacterium]
MKKRHILFRADGNRNIGLGHISRCLALAELLHDDFEIYFAICEPEAYVLDEVKKITLQIISLPKPASIDDFNGELSSYLTGREIVVLDGYSFTTEYESIVKKSAASVIAIDDIPNRHFVADGVINFCGTIDASEYSKEFYTQLYIGFDYLFLRKPFLRMQSKKSPSDMLLLNMGGADSGNETQRILHEVLESGFSGRILVIIGQSYPYKASLEPIVRSHSFITVKQGLTALEMFNAMNQCAMAILTPSTVALEFLSTGGVLFVNQTAKNQQCIKEYLLRQKLAFDYSEFMEFVTVNRNNANKVASGKSDGLIDGSSLQRVKDLFISISISANLKFRKAVEKDVALVFKWANDPEVRKYSYSNSEILWQEHVQWFARKISDPLCEYFIVEMDKGPIAQIRFDFSREEHGAYVISYQIDKNWRGKGLGYPVLVKGMQKLIEVRTVEKIIGYVQNSNIPSIKAFRSAGFREIVSLKYSNSSKFELSFLKV